MSADEDGGKSERERLDADRRYNDALTAFDGAVAACAGRPLERADFDRVAHALIIYLQQITAFVDTKDRAIAADLRARLVELDRLRASTDELSTRVSVLQRQAKAVVSRQSSVVSQRARGSSSPSSPEAPSGGPESSDIVYVGFEDQFRGSDAAVAAKLTTYVPLFAGARDVVDLGCGRGEFLAALKDAGVPALGVDTNAEMVAVARERGLDVRQADALSFVGGLPDESIGGVIATQVIEHLEPSYLVRLLEALGRKLQRGAPAVFETINPACWLAFFSSYIRDFTHVRPIHPDTLQYLLRASGFERVEIRYSAPVPEQMKMKTMDLPAAILSSTEPIAAALTQLAHTVNANAAILNSLMFTHLDYAAIGFRT